MLLLRLRLRIGLAVAFAAVVVVPLHLRHVREEVRVLRLAHELAADAVDLQRGQAEAVAANEVAGGDALEQRSQLILGRGPAC